MRENNGPDLGTLIVFLNSEKVDFEKKSADDKKHAKLPSKELKEETKAQRGSFSYNSLDAG